MTSRDHPPQPQSDVRVERNGTFIALLIFGLSFALALTPAAELVKYAYPVLTVTAMWRLLRRGRVQHAIELNLWTWATAAGLRRVVDWSAGSFDPNNPILVTASVAALLLLLAALRPEGRWPPGFGFGLFTVALTGAFASLIGLQTHGLVPAATSAVLFFAPLVVGLTLLTAGDHLMSRVDAILRFSRWALLLLSGYAIVQWAMAPPWDVFWLENAIPYAATWGSPFGTPEPFGIRPSSLFNSPYGFAHLLVWLLVSQIRRVAGGPVLTYTGVTVGCLALGLTGIRAGWLTATLVLALLVASGQVRLSRLAALGAVTTYVAVTFIPLAAHTIAERLGTAGSATTDVSLLARLGKYATALPFFFNDPIGEGMGSTGAGARADAQGRLRFAFSLDSSYLDILRVHGSVLGTVMIMVVIAMSIGAFSRCLGLAPPFPAWSALALVLPVDMLFGAVIDGPQAVITWTVLGACAAASTARKPAIPLSPARPAARSSRAALM